MSDAWRFYSRKRDVAAFMALVFLFTVGVSAGAQTYKVGDQGPAGGLIFYDKGNDTDGWRYLEAAPAETEKGSPFYINYASRTNSHLSSKLETEEGLGAGKKNTESIVSHLFTLGQWDMAAQVCDELEVNGYDDWFMPSFLELSMMYGNLHRRGLGDFKNEVYYSSSIRTSWNEGYAVGFNFADGSSGTYYTEGEKPVRAIRRF
jgi:hypothetical protein